MTAKPGKPEAAVASVSPLVKRLAFLDAKAFRDRVWIGLAVLLVGLIGADLIVHRHDYFDAAERFGFYGVFGFAAFALVVLSGWPLRRLLGRRETYYGGDDDGA